MDATEFKARYLPLHAAVYREAFRLTSNAQDAEDLMQDVYLLLWRKRERLPLEAATEAYMVVTTRHLYLSQQRRGRVDCSLPLTDALATACEPPAPNEAEHLARAMQSLSPREQDIVKQRLVEGRSYNELAGTTGLGAAHLRQIVKRARQKIKDKFIAITHNES